MKLLLLALLVASATAAPLPLEEEAGNPVELIINGHPENEPLEIGHIVDIKVQEHEDGKVVATNNLLYPLTAQGLAEAAPTEEEKPVEDEIESSLPEAPVVVFPDVPGSVDLPSPGEPAIVFPEIVPEPDTDGVEPVIVAPGANPEAVELPDTNPVIVEGPEIIPENIETLPEVVDGILPAAPQIPNGQIYNDGLVEITVNTPDDSSVVDALQSWVSMILNYFNPAEGVQATHQII